MIKINEFISGLLVVSLMIIAMPSNALAESSIQLESIFVNQEYSTVDFEGLSKEGIAMVGKDNKYGFIDKTGQLVITLQYGNFNNFSEGLAVVRQNNKYGYMNSKGDVDIYCKYYSAESFNNGLAKVALKKDGKILFGYINKSGEEVIPIIYSSISAFTNEYAIASIYDEGANNTRFYLINTSGESKLIEGKYPEFIDGGKYIKALDNEGKYTVFDFNGTPLYSSDSKYIMLSNDYVTILKNGKYGYMSLGGNINIACEYYTASFYDTNDIAIVSKERGSYYGINKLAKEIIQPDKYTNIVSFPINKNKDNKYYYMISKLDENKFEKVGCVDFQGNVVIPAIYDSIDINNGFRNDLIRVKAGKKYGFVNKNGKLTIPAVYDAAMNFSDGLAPTKIEGKWGVIDTLGNTVIPFQYDEINPEGIINSMVSVKKDGKCGVIDISGNTIIPYDYKNMEDIIITNDGFIWASTNIDTKDNNKNKEYSLFKAHSLKKAEETNSSILIDDEKVPFEAFNIDGNNYFKLRDIAKALQGSKKQFEIGWDASTNSITITTGKVYTSVGGELSKPKNTDNKSATISDSKVLLNGKEIKLNAYNIDGNNYFKLRDIATYVDFNLKWNEIANTIGVDTSSSYTK